MEIFYEGSTSWVSFPAILLEDIFSIEVILNFIGMFDNIIKWEYPYTPIPAPWLKPTDPELAHRIVPDYCKCSLKVAC